MATLKRWTNALADGDASNNANWDPSKPAGVDADSVVCDATATKGDIITGLDFDGVRVVDWHIQSGFHGKIGSTGNPLIISASNQILHEGRGELHFENGPDGGSAYSTQLVNINAGNHVAAAFIDGSVIKLAVLKGRVKTLPGFGFGTLTRVLVSYRNNSHADAFVHLQNTATLHSVVQAGGIVINDLATITNMILYDGTFTQALGANGIVMAQIGGGRLIHNTSNLIAEAHVLGGVLDFSLTGNTKTVTSLSVGQGGRFIPNADTTVSIGGTLIGIEEIRP